MLRKSFVKGREFKVLEVVTGIRRLREMKVLFPIHELRDELRELQELELRNQFEIEITWTPSNITRPANPF